MAKDKKTKPLTDEQKAKERKRELTAIFKALDCFVEKTPNCYAMHVAHIDIKDGKMRAAATDGKAMLIVELTPKAEQTIPCGYYVPSAAIAQVKAGQDLKPVDDIGGHFPPCDAIINRAKFADKSAGKIRMGVELLQRALSAFNALQSVGGLGGVDIHIPEDAKNSIKIRTVLGGQFAEGAFALIMPMIADS